jgi:uroporphyrinogen decarboxylase
MAADARMSPRERFLRTVRFETVDRPFYWELGFWGQTLERWLGEGMPEEALSENVWRGSEFWCVDRHDYADVNVLAVPAFEYAVLEEDERTVTFVDTDGATRMAMKEGVVRGTRPSMDQFIRFAVETSDDFQRLKERFRPVLSERVPGDWDALVAEWATRDYPLCLLRNATFGLYSLLRRYMGTERLSYAWYDRPALLHEMLDFFTDFLIELTAPVLGVVDFDYFNFFEDLAYKTGPLLSPALFSEFLVPRYRRIIDHLRAHGCDVITYDSDGNTEVLVRDLIDVGVNLIWPCECAAGMDVVRLRAEYGRDLAFAGGIDKRELAKGPAAIEAEVARKLPPLLDQGGYIPTVDHTVPPDVSYGDFRHYLDVKCAAAEGRHSA